MQQSDAVAQLDAARAAVADGDYAKALAQCDKAIAQQPNDVVLHEFRGLALFALHRYKEAAGTIYAVLSIGPGWDWTTLSGFYPDVNIYTQQHLHPATSRIGAVCQRALKRGRCKVPGGVSLFDVRAYRQGRRTIQVGGAA